MRYYLKILLAVGFSLLMTVATIAETISPEEASSYVGKFATVEGTVAEVSESNKGTVFINFGGRYPNQVFYAVIFSNNADQFTEIHGLEGRSVAISGTVELYKGKLEIVVESPSQIEVK